jgi:hypothetical protein
MDNFFYLANTSYFSSSLVKDSLVVGESTGDLLVVVSQLSAVKSDSYKKDVNFYPADDCCFTTTDSRGIRVWDRAREEVVYAYREEPIRMHIYDRDGCMAAVADGCVKFYDLRVRYHVGAAALRMCQMAEWARDRTVYVLSDGRIVELDARKMGTVVNRGKEIKSGERVLSFASLENGLFCTAERRGGHVLLKLNDEGFVERPCVGHRITKIRDEWNNFAFCIINKDTAVFYEHKDTWSYAFPDLAAVQDVRFGEHNSYLFADQKIFCMEGGYEKFKELHRSR